MDSHTRREAVEADFRQRLEIDTLVRNPRYEPAQLEELLDNIVDMYSCEAPMQYIGQQMQTHQSHPRPAGQADQPERRVHHGEPEQYHSAHQEYPRLSAHRHPERPGTMESYYQVQANAAVAASSHPPAPAAV